MKTDEELGPDRGFVFETDDEEDEAERVEGSEEDEGSDYSYVSRNQSDHRIGSYCPSWPQSYRQSIDMLSSVTPPNVGLLKGSTRAKLSSSFRTSSKHSILSTMEIDPALSTPFISTDVGKDTESLPSPIPWNRSKSSVQECSYHDLVVSNKCSYGQSLLNGINILCGVGLLTTPYAIKEGGWIGLLLLLGFGLISCYTGILLKRCLESTPGLHTYPDIGQAAFGTFGRLSIAIILYIELYICCVEYIILVSDNLSSLFPNAHMNLVGVYLNCHQLFAVMTTLTVLPTVWLRNLSFLSYLSAGGVVATVLVVVCLLWVGTVDQVGFHPSGSVLDLSNLPVALGLYGFCYSGHSVFPNIYSSMQKPAQFPSVLIVSFIVCWLLYSGVAVAGFLMFGESIQSQFTLNMPQQFMASKMALWTAVVNPLTKYALTITPVALSLEELLPSSPLKSRCISVLIRTVLVVSTLVVALAIPFFGFVMAFIGSFLTMLIALIFPCACYLRIMRGRLSWVQVAVCVLIIVVGVICSIVGTYSSIKRIADNIV
ncbi:amino acid transporter AVT1C-like [Tasmannia lanceolata]|uniref:amino acid transporter AVT1C-like n=1 Tax=Tasmannia lanceolata TaxID=3420 RepID=UPI00406350DA